VSDSRLVGLVGALVRRERQVRGVTQVRLAGRAGVSQGELARIERGDRAGSLRTVERLLAELGLQLRIGVEPLDAHVDAELERLGGVPLADRLDELRLDRLLDSLGDLPLALDGPTAALLQGAALPGHHVHLVVTWDSADRFTEWLEAQYGHRWHEAWQAYGYVPLDPRGPGAHRWRTRHGEVVVRFVDVLPATLEVRHRERGYPVVPIADIVVEDARTAELLDRHRALRRRRAGTG
jgi:transcriptional regulator with XRE-family HTH domain